MTRQIFFLLLLVAPLIIFPIQHAYAGIDGDGIPDSVDNCINNANPGQYDTDGDGLGDVCDPNDDNDAWDDRHDNCPLGDGPLGQRDSDGDGLGDHCDSVSGMIRMIQSPSIPDTGSVIRNPGGNVIADFGNGPTHAALFMDIAESEVEFVEFTFNMIPVGSRFIAEGLELVYQDPDFGIEGKFMQTYADNDNQMDFRLVSPDGSVLGKIEGRDFYVTIVTDLSTGVAIGYGMFTWSLDPDTSFVRKAIELGVNEVPRMFIMLNQFNPAITCPPGTSGNTCVGTLYINSVIPQAGPPYAGPLICIDGMILRGDICDISGPLDRVPASNLMITDIFGSQINEINVGQMVQITAEVTNNQDVSQLFAYLVQIQDSNGVTESISFVTGSLIEGQTFNPGTSWVPGASGAYTITIFVWESLINPTALSPPLTITVNVL